MKKTLIIAVTAIIAVGAGVFVLLKKPALKTAQKPDANAVHVLMLQDEYKPSELTIKKGQTVVFTNKSEDWRWPASNLHPTHDIYPEFDPKEPIGAGKSWSFTFDKPGTWAMHDHLAPYITGVITVTP